MDTHSQIIANLYMRVCLVLDVTGLAGSAGVGWASKHSLIYNHSMPVIEVMNVWDDRCGANQTASSLVDNVDFLRIVHTALIQASGG